MKVIIADDEIHICSLLRHLIQWERLGLTLLDVFYNGNDVLEQFKKEPADILICDIEMPGMSGNELIGHIAASYPSCKCIVISGFRSFEYARSAMQYGVTNYLLKPIDGNELNAALRAIVSSAGIDIPQASAITRQSIRYGLSDMLSSEAVALSLQEANRKYQFEFCEGYFIAIKTVLTDIDISSDFLPRIMGMLSDTLIYKLMDFCCDAEVFRLSPVCAFVLLNYAPEHEALIHSMVDKALRETLIELGGKTQCKCYCGVGVPVRRLGDIPLSWQSAMRVVCGRIESESRQIYYAERAPDVPCASREPVGPKEEQELANYIEAINIPNIKVWIDHYYTAVERENKNALWRVFSLCYNVVDLIVSVFDKLGVPISDKQAFRKRAELIFDSCGTSQVLKEALFAVVEGEISKRLSDKQQNMAMYVQQAKQYISLHYAESVTLETIASRLYISPVYLSIIFKSETGMNYSKYLAGVRIEKAKELLKNYAMNLSQVANSVGYDSTNYFSNLFKKHTGIKPLEYRRLHQQDIGL